MSFSYTAHSNRQGEIYDRMEKDMDRTPALRAYMGIQRIIARYKLSKRFSRVIDVDTNSNAQQISSFTDKAVVKRQTRREEPNCKHRSQSIPRILHSKVNTPAVGTYALKSSMSQRSFTMRKQSFSTPQPKQHSSPSPIPHSSLQSLHPYYSYRVKPKEVSDTSHKFDLLKPEFSLSRLQKTNFHALSSDDSLQVLSKAAELSSQLHRTRLKLRTYSLLPVKPS